jgi:hypothetical protein
MRAIKFLVYAAVLTMAEAQVLSAAANVVNTAKATVLKQTPQIVRGIPAVAASVRTLPS